MRTCKAQNFTFKMLFPAAVESVFSVFQDTALEVRQNSARSFLVHYFRQSLSHRSFSFILGETYLLDGHITNVSHQLSRTERTKRVDTQRSLHKPGQSQWRFLLSSYRKDILESYAWHFRAEVLFIKLTPSLCLNQTQYQSTENWHRNSQYMNFYKKKNKKGLKPLVTSQEQHKALDHIISRLSPGSSNTEAHALAASI